MEHRRRLRFLAASFLLSTLFAVGDPPSVPAAPPSQVQLDLTAFQSDASVVLPLTIGFLSVSGATNFAIDVVAAGNVTDVSWLAAAPSSSLTLEKNLHGILSVQGTLKSVTISGNILEANTIVIDAPVESVFIDGNTAQPIIISADVGELRITGNVNNPITINGPATVGAIIVEGNLNDDITVGSGATVNTIFIAGNFTGGAEIIVEDGGYVGTLLVGGEFNGESPVPPQEGDPACVPNHAPVASSVVSPPSPTVGTVVTLDATGSTDPDPGDTLTFRWSVVSAPEPVVFSPDAVSSVVSFTPGTAGTYSLRLTATDACGFVDTMLLSVEATTSSLRALIVYADLPTLEIRAGIFDFSSIPPAHVGSVVLPVDPETESALPGLAVTPNGEKAIVFLGESQSKALRLDLSGPTPVVDGGPIFYDTEPLVLSSKGVAPDSSLALVPLSHHASDGKLVFLDPSGAVFGEVFAPLDGPLGSDVRGVAVEPSGASAVVSLGATGGFAVVDLGLVPPDYAPPLISLQELGGSWDDVAVVGSTAYIARNPTPKPGLGVEELSGAELLVVDLLTRTLAGVPLALPGHQNFIEVSPNGELAVLVGTLDEEANTHRATIVDLALQPPQEAGSFLIQGVNHDAFLNRPSISTDGRYCSVARVDEVAPLLLIDLSNLGQAPVEITQAVDGTDLTITLAAEFLP